MRLARRPFLVSTGLGLVLGSRGAAAAAPIQGSGVATTQRRDIGAFVGVSLGAPFSVVLRQGSREAIEIVADDNLLPLIETTLRGVGAERMLQIDLPRDVRVAPRTPIVVTVDWVRLASLAVGGTGRIDGRSMKASTLDAAIGGSGAIDLVDLEVASLAVSVGGSGAFRADGRARKISVSLSGSGRCDAERLIAADVAVSVAGSGDVRVRAETALRASIAGSGTLYHSGAAMPQLAIAGSGRATRI